MKPRLIKRVGAGEMLPRWHGVVYHDYYQNQVVCIPVPFNVAARCLRLVWVWIRFGCHAVPSSPMEAYAQGVWQGMKQSGGAYDKGLEDGRRKALEECGLCGNPAPPPYWRKWQKPPGAYR